MKVEVLIRLENNPDSETGRTDDLFYVHRAESLAFTPEDNADPERTVAAFSRQFEEVLDGATLAARARVAVAADYVKEAGGS